MRDDRPAVVLTGAHHIELVAALRPMLMGPQLAGRRVQGGALDVAVAQGPLLGQCPRLLHKGVVGGHPTVVVQANHRAGMVVPFLRAMAVAPVTQGQVEHPRLVEHNAPTKVLHRAGFGLHAEQDLHLGHAHAHEFAARQRSAPTASAGRAVGPVNPAVLRILRMQHHIEQASLALCRDGGQPLDGLGFGPKVGAQQAHAPGPFGDQHPAIGQEGDRPGILEAAGEGHHPKREQLRSHHGRTFLGHGLMAGPQAQPAQAHACISPQGHDASGQTRRPCTACA